MHTFERRTFIKLLAAAGLSSTFDTASLNAELRHLLQNGNYTPGRIVNEYSHFLPGEKEALARVPAVTEISGVSLNARTGEHSATLSPGETIDGWRLLAIADINGSLTAVFEKHVTHRGAIAYVTPAEGTIALMPKLVGDLAMIRPRAIDTSGGVRLERHARYTPGPDVAGEYILNSNEDPCYENVAALGPEYIGWTLVANEEAGPLRSLYLEANGRSRQLNNDPAQAAWAPDELGAVFDPADLFPNDNLQLWQYEKGFSKRTLLGGYAPIADTGVWNEKFQCGYEAIVLLPPGETAQPMARMRIMVPDNQVTPGMKVYRNGGGLAFIDRYHNATPSSFFSVLAGVWNRWQSFYEESMPVEIPDPWLLDAARAGITLSRCSYRGLEPTYQVGEGGYTKIPERSHALFPVAHYEFIWAQQLWNLTQASDPYFQHYLDTYILPDGNFVYNTQDQVEGPLNTGLFLSNSARGFFYTGDLEALRRRLPVLDRMIAFVLRRYEYAKQQFSPEDRRYGLIWGSPEADLGDPHNDFPNSHPCYYQNTALVWRGLNDHARSLTEAAKRDPTLQAQAILYAAIAAEMRGNVQRSLAATLAASDKEMRDSGIAPFTPNDLHHRATVLSSYENHRFMQDWFLADWGDPALDLGHLKHRELAGMQILGLHTDGVSDRTSNFMDHGSLAVKIRQPDYRPFLLNLYALVCYAADSGNRYAPEDAFIPGSYAGEGSPYGWSAVINSTLQPTLGLRWLLCYEESDASVCHLQKAAPKHWFAEGEFISVKRCPTRFGTIGWKTIALANRRWRVSLMLPAEFSGDLHVHIHPPDGRPLLTVSLGKIQGDAVVIKASQLAGRAAMEIEVV